MFYETLLTSRKLIDDSMIICEWVNQWMNGLFSHGAIQAWDIWLMGDSLGRHPTNSGTYTNDSNIDLETCSTVL